jgi:Fe2+ transport system protein B
MSDESAPNGGSRPIPDPTVLTDAAIARSERAMRDYVDGQLSVRDERLAGIDEATKLRLGSVVDFSPEIDTKVSGLEKLMDNKFESAERLRVEQKKDTKDAVDAALNAAKEAVKEQTASSEKSITKSELATGAQIKQLQDTFATAIEGLRRSFDDLKDREVEDVRTLRQSITDVATTANGSNQRQVGAKEDRSALYATIGLVITMVLFGIAILGFVAAQATP